MAEDDRLRQRSAEHVQQRAQLDTARARGFPTTADSGERTDDPDHLAGKAIIGVVAALVLLVAVGSHDASLAVVGVEIVVGLLLVTDAWGLRSRLPLLSSHNRVEAVIGWLDVLLVAIALRQLAAIWF